MTDEERMLAKKAVVDSVRGLRDRILLNFEFVDEAKELIERFALLEIKDGMEDIDRISNPEHPSVKAEKDVWYVETNAHKPM